MSIKKEPLKSGSYFLCFFLLCSERQQRNVARALDSDRHLALMLGAVSGNTARKNLPTLRNEPAQLACIFVVDVIHLVHAEGANLFARAAASVTSDHDSFLLQNGISSSVTEALSKDGAEG